MPPHVFTDLAEAEADDGSPLQKKSKRSPSRSGGSGSSPRPGEEDGLGSSSFASPSVPSPPGERGSPFAPGTEPQDGETAFPWALRHTPRRASAAAAATLSEMRASPSPSQSSGGGRGGASRRVIMMPDRGGQALTPGPQQRQRQSPSPSRAGGATPSTPEAPQPEPDSESAAAAAAAAAAARAAYRSRLTVDALRRRVAVYATLLEEGRVPEHGRRASCCDAWGALVGGRGQRRLLLEAAKAAAAVGAGDKDALWSLVERLMAAIETAMEARPGEWCACLLLPPKAQWTGEANRALARLARECLREPIPEKTHPWRIELIELEGTELKRTMENAPAVIARFVARHADKWGGRVMVFHELQTKCAYNSCLCLSPWHAIVMPYAEGALDNVRNIKEDDVARKEAETAEQGLVAEIERQLAPFRPPKTHKARQY